MVDMAKNNQHTGVDNHRRAVEFQQRVDQLLVKTFEDETSLQSTVKLNETIREEKIGTSAKRKKKDSDSFGKRRKE